MFITATWWITLGLVALVAHSAVGLVAIWAGLGKPHWFFRVAVVGGVLTLGLPIPAYDLVVIFLAQSAVTILPLMVLRHLRARPIDRGSESSAGPTARSRTQLSLLDLLLITVVVSCLVAFAVHVPIDAWLVWRGSDLFGGFFGISTPVAAWTVFGLIGVCFGISTLAAAWVALGTGRWWLRLSVLCLLPVSAIMAAWLALLRASGCRATGALHNGPISTGATIAGARQPVIPRLARVAVVLLSVAILLPLAAVYYELVTPVPIPETTLPEENGYDALVQAGEYFSRVRTPNTDVATEADLRAFVTEHRHALDEARTALDQECCVTLKYAHSDGFGLVGVRQLGEALVAEGRLAEMEGRTSDAVESYLATIRLGGAGSRGGLVVHWLVGLVVERMGVVTLKDLPKKLPPDRCRELAALLQCVDAEREPLATVFRRDTAWSMRVGGWPIRLLMMVSDESNSMQPMWEDTQKTYRVSTRLLICDLAIRSYRSDHDSFPKELSDLVPEYLPAVPQDPFSGRPLVYRPTATDYQLYSVGPDGNDDGGISGGMCSLGEPGDLLLDESPEDEQE